MGGPVSGTRASRPSRTLDARSDALHVAAEARAVEVAARALRRPSQSLPADVARVERRIAQCSHSLSTLETSHARIHDALRDPSQAAGHDVLRHLLHDVERNGIGARASLLAAARHLENAPMSDAAGCARDRRARDPATRYFAPERLHRPSARADVKHTHRLAELEARATASAPETRADALSSLERLGGAHAALERLARHDDVVVRRAARLALVRRGGHADLDALARAMGHDDADERLALVTVLRPCEGAAARTVLERLACDDDGVVREAAHATLAARLLRTPAPLDAAAASRAARNLFAPAHRPPVLHPRDPPLRARRLRSFAVTAAIRDDANRMLDAMEGSLLHRTAMALSRNEALGALASDALVSHLDFMRHARTALPRLRLPPHPRIDDRFFVRSAQLQVALACGHAQPDDVLDEVDALEDGEMVWLPILVMHGEQQHAVELSMQREPDGALVVRLSEKGVREPGTPLPAGRIPAGPLSPAARATLRGIVQPLSVLAGRLDDVIATIEALGAAPAIQGSETPQLGDMCWFASMGVLLRWAVGPENWAYLKEGYFRDVVEPLGTRARQERAERDERWVEKQALAALAHASPAGLLVVGPKGRPLLFDALVHDVDRKACALRALPALPRGSMTELVLRASLDARVDVVTSLARMPATAVSMRDTFGQTPLQWAVAAGNLGVVRALLDRHVDVDDVSRAAAIAETRDSDSSSRLELLELLARRAPSADPLPLARAKLRDALIESSRRRLAELLARETGARALVTHPSDGTRSVFERSLAAPDAFADVLTSALQTRALGAVDESGGNVLHQLARFEGTVATSVHAAIAALPRAVLASLAARVDDDGFTPLGRACLHRDRALAPLLYTRVPGSLDVRQGNGAGLTTLMLATRTADAKHVQRLLEAAPHLLHALDAEGQSALHHAVRTGNSNVPQWLVAAGANPSLRATAGTSPISHLERQYCGGRDVPTLLRDGAAVIAREHPGFIRLVRRPARR